VTRVRKVAAVSLMTPMAAAAVALGSGGQASAVEACAPLASATINAPTGTVAVGSTVHVSAQISGLMLLQAHLQATGPGLDQQVGKSVMSGTISGNVTVPKAGTYTLAVIGNGTKCTYKSAEFKAKQRAVASPTQSGSPGSTPGAGRTPGRHSVGNGANPLPRGAGGGAAGGGGYGLPLNGASPFSLPPVAPDGSAQGFAYPSPEPQVASPPTQPAARSVAETQPVKWGQSLAIALVLLVISAHLGMWSRRQRLAAEGAHSKSPVNGRGGRKRAARKTPRESETIMAATATATATATSDESVDAAQDGVGATSAGAADRRAGVTDTTTDPTDHESGVTPDASWIGRSDAEATRGENGDATTWADLVTGRPTDPDTEPIATRDVSGAYDRVSGAYDRASGGFTTATPGRTPADDMPDGDAPSARGRHGSSADGRPWRSSGRGYHGRRRRD
jgi:hypothetical protein